MTPHPLRRLVRSLGERVIAESDSQERRLAKTLLIFACGLMGFGAMLWLLIYQLMGIRYSATVPLAYLAVSAGTLGVYFWNRNFEFFRFAQATLFLFVPFIMQWSIGSYVTSSGVALWALLAPVGVMMFQGPRESVPWFVAYAVLTAMSGFFDYFLGYGERMLPLPMETIAVFFVLNFSAVSTIVYLLVVYFVREKERLRLEVEEQRRLLELEQEKSERLLLNVLPAPIAERLKHDPNTIAERCADVTVMFADLVDFTRLSAELPPEQMVELLNSIFSEFDRLADKYRLEKALEMREVAAGYRTPAGGPIEIHAGIATGPVVAGVIGTKKFIYDLWGNTVNVASRLSTEATAGGILVNSGTHGQLGAGYRFEGPETLAVKGIRQLVSYRLLGRRPATVETGAR
jgi:adenylate cyclase